MIGAQEQRQSLFLFWVIQTSTSDPSRWVKENGTRSLKVDNLHHKCDGNAPKKLTRHMRSVDVVGSVDSNKWSSWSDHWLGHWACHRVTKCYLYFHSSGRSGHGARRGESAHSVQGVWHTQWNSGTCTCRMVWSASCQHVLFSHVDIRWGSGSILMSAAPPPQGAECQLMWTFVKNLIKTLGQHNIATLSLSLTLHTSAVHD